MNKLLELMNAAVSTEEYNRYIDYVVAMKIKEKIIEIETMLLEMTDLPQETYDGYESDVNSLRRTYKYFSN